MERFIQQQIPLMTTRSVPEAPCPSCGVQSVAVAQRPAQQQAQTASETPSEANIRRNPAKDASKREQSESSFGSAEREHTQPKVKTNTKQKKK